MTLSDEAEANMRHSLAHLLAAAVLKLYPEAKPAIGPAIETGFYYDFDFGRHHIGQDDLVKIEAAMKKILPTWQAFERQELTAEAAKKLFADNPYKLELIEDLKTTGEVITTYTAGSAKNQFIDLCRGGHVDDMQTISPDCFKLNRLAGAYWRGDENNKMLTRIYGLAFQTKQDLDQYLDQLAEAEKRDHRRLGRQLDLFTFSDLVGPGLPLWTPKGTILRTQLQNKLVAISQKHGYQPVTIPHLAKHKLYELSGHAEKFTDELLTVTSRYDTFALKPVNCPHHTQIYASQLRSYRDLPIRYMESTMQYRDEKPGEISGLTRVRSITVDDGHIFCTPDQLSTEIKNIAQIIKEFYTSLGLYGQHWVSLSVRNPNTPEAYIGDEAGWQQAELVLQTVSDELKLEAERIVGEAAIYGPKLDYMFKDSLGRQWQLATIQIDFAMPARFNLEYIDQSGQKQTPVMIHRAILGSYERFLAILIEHFAGDFPVWLAPIQAAIATVNDNHLAWAQKTYNQLTAAGIRTELYTATDNLSKKIKIIRDQKVPYWLVIGDQEVKQQVVTACNRQGQKQTLTPPEFIHLISKANDQPPAD